MKNAKIDRDDDSMNDLSEIDRRDFFSRKNFIDESHLMNWLTDWMFWDSIEDDCCLFNDSKIEDDDRCLIDYDDEDRCLINWDENRCLIDNFSLFSDWEWWRDFSWVDSSRSDDCIDCSRSDNCRADSDFCDPDRDCVCHEIYEIAFEIDFAKMTISSSIQSVRCSFSRIPIKNFAIVICEFFKIHTSRFRRAFRKRLRRMFNTSDLKSSSIQSTKFSLNCFHSVSFFRFSRSYKIIVVCTKMFLFILRTRTSTFLDSRSER
jgi:hypothetical protein